VAPKIPAQSIRFWISQPQRLSHHLKAIRRSEKAAPGVKIRGYVPELLGGILQGHQQQIRPGRRRGPGHVKNKPEFQGALETRTLRQRLFAVKTLPSGYFRSSPSNTLKPCAGRRGPAAPVRGGAFEKYVEGGAAFHTLRGQRRKEDGTIRKTKSRSERRFPGSGSGTAAKRFFCAVRPGC